MRPIRAGARAPLVCLELARGVLCGRLLCIEAGARPVVHAPQTCHDERNFCAW